MTEPPKRPSKYGPPPGAAPPSNREKMRDAVQDLVQQVKDQKQKTVAEKRHEEQKAKQKQRRRLLETGVLVVALIASILWAIPKWNAPFSTPTGAEARKDARKALVFASRLLDQYQLRAGRFPGTFAQVGVSLPGLVYTPMGDTYTLRLDVDGQAITFRHGDDPVRFLSSP